LREARDRIGHREDRDSWGQRSVRARAEERRALPLRDRHGEPAQRGSLTLRETPSPSGRAPTGGAFSVRSIRLAEADLAAAHFEGRARRVLRALRLTRADPEAPGSARVARIACVARIAVARGLALGAEEEARAREHGSARLVGDRRPLRVGAADE